MATTTTTQPEIKPKPQAKSHQQPNPTQQITTHEGKPPTTNRKSPKISPRTSILLKLTLNHISILPLGTIDCYPQNTHLNQDSKLIRWVKSKYIFIPKTIFDSIKDSFFHGIYSLYNRSHALPLYQLKYASISLLPNDQCPQLCTLQLRSVKTPFLALNHKGLEFGFSFLQCLQNWLLQRFWLGGAGPSLLNLPISAD
ncbi:hypothetical protein EYC80_000589 [Monilinia laxa]|uniref:Uncharacterized protein n=1 Tax=Monilinia laxa TaxID=61186 RepID=A0A5N6KB62_MONLA|nr:hypothetical protein EYC80_000589 [Monilinia laxa]